MTGKYKGCFALDATTTWLLFIALGLVALSLGGCDVSNGHAEQGEDLGYPVNGSNRVAENTVPLTETAFLPYVVKPPEAYYVSPQGDDGNDGKTRDAAFRTIKRALQVVQPGEVVVILPGTYHEALLLENAGSPDAAITIRGEGDKPVLDGQGTMTIGFWFEKCRNFVIENLEIQNYTDIGIGVTLSSDFILRDLIVHNNGFDVQLVSWEIEGYGIDVDDAQRITVENNDVYQNGPQPRPWGMLGTGINTFMCSDCVIRGNESHENIGGGILVEDGINVLVENNNVFDNYLDATEDEWWDGGIWVDGGHDVVVKNNVFQGNIGPGIQISDEDFQHPYGYVLEGNLSTGNVYGLYIWNFGTPGFPPENILRMTNNQITGNTLQDVWIVP